jgi:hypothetical protein
MRHHTEQNKKHCRRCGKQYTAEKPLYRDGFCGPKCKQAHYRAFKAYKNSVTTTKQLSSDIRPGCQQHAVTQKRGKND